MIVFLTMWKTFNMFPLKNYQYQIPQGDEFGAFGVSRLHDIHTGVDLYCDALTEVFAMEEGVVVNIAAFTGAIAGFPWWNDTYAVLVQGKSGVINYGEILPNTLLEIGDYVAEGASLGYVIPVLKVDKGKVPSTSMLHVELYKTPTTTFTEWLHGKDQPKNLDNPTNLLLSQLP